MKLGRPRKFKANDLAFTNDGELYRVLRVSDKRDTHYDNYSHTYYRLEHADHPGIRITKRSDKLVIA